MGQRRRRWPIAETAPGLSDPCLLVHGYITQPHSKILISRDADQLRMLPFGGINATAYITHVQTLGSPPNSFISTSGVSFSAARRCHGDLIKGGSITCQIWY